MGKTSRKRLGCTSCGWIGTTPQLPTLFEGSIRFNLDPFEEIADDSRIWGALDEVGMGEFVRSHAEGLDWRVAEDGGNLSVGQQQLICLSRALLKKEKIILLDEATSSIDGQTDAMIQRAIRTCFVDATVITVAHRLVTVGDADVIVVMERGAVVESGRPAELLRKEGSRFWEMGMANGESEIESYFESLFVCKTNEEMNEPILSETIQRPKRVSAPLRGRGHPKQIDVLSSTLHVRSIRDKDEREDRLSQTLPEFGRPMKPKQRNAIAVPSPHSKSAVELRPLFLRLSVANKVPLTIASIAFRSMVRFFEEREPVTRQALEQSYSLLKQLEPEFGFGFSADEVLFSLCPSDDGDSRNLVSSLKILLSVKHSGLTESVFGFVLSLLEKSTANQRIELATFGQISSLLSSLPQLDIELPSSKMHQQMTEMLHLMGQSGVPKIPTQNKDETRDSGDEVFRSLLKWVFLPKALSCIDWCCGKDGPRNGRRWNGWDWWRREEAEGLVDVFEAKLMNEGTTGTGASIAHIQTLSLGSYATKFFPCSSYTKIDKSTFFKVTASTHNISHLAHETDRYRPVLARKEGGDKGDGTRATARTFSGLVKGGSEEYRKDKSLASNSDTSESLYQSGTETSILEVFHPSVRFHVEGTEQDTLHFRRSVDEPMLISTVMR
ncbi:putative ABC transporter C family member 5 [Blattamonas nauphoetae]|uniref:ABC transporter C family member 5 n=1 Tax=Blattamonas nauphoetae TaxID=2049346 RepID=A0ABQ9XSR8_9EUKA|nr:putative ABC transporter C family member 5 [Blattamonas nauphoetae]